MAIFSFSAKPIKRSNGQSAVASAAYRSGEKIYDERIGKTHDYSKKKGVAESFIMTPESSPEWMKDRKKLWNHIEQKENRVNSQLSRDFTIALPVELSLDKNKELISEYVQENFVSKGLVCDVNIHMDNEKNPHVHVMTTLSGVEGDDFGKKTDYRHLNDKEQLDKWRESWAATTNKHLEREGVEERIDHRSFKSIGKEEQPQIHLGPNVHQMIQKGIVTDRFKEYAKIQSHNEELKQLNTDIKKYEQQKQQQTVAPKKQEVTRHITPSKGPGLMPKMDGLQPKSLGPSKTLKNESFSMENISMLDGKIKDLLASARNADERVKDIDKTLGREHKAREGIRNLHSKLDGLKRKLIKSKSDKEEIERLKNELFEKEENMKEILTQKPRLEKERQKLKRQSTENMNKYRKLSAQRIDLITKGTNKTKDKSMDNGVEM